MHAIYNNKFILQNNEDDNFIILKDRKEGGYLYLPQQYSYEIMVING